MAPQYHQKFRKEWLSDALFKNWLVELDDKQKVSCKFCKCEIKSKRYDLVQHMKSKKHLAASKDFSTSRSIRTFTKVTSTKTAEAEGATSLFIAAHCSILSCDHLGELCQANFKDSEAGLNMRLHRSKFTAIINNVLGPHFANDLRTSIGNRRFSIIIDESTDISVLKFLGITITYFDICFKQITSTYLSLVELEECDANAIIHAIKSTLHSKQLNLQNLCGIGTDNASVMVGINNGVFKKLKEEIPALIHVPCVCHSLQLAVSAAAADALPRNIEYIIRETYNWFAHSSLRQAEYKNMYKAINDGHDPLKIVRSCDTRWMSIESAVARILHQWTELKTLFGIAKNKNKCYAADILYEMYNDPDNLAYLTFLQPILEEVQMVNKSFESSSDDISKLLNDLTNLVKSISKRFVNPNCRKNPLTTNIGFVYDTTSLFWL